MLHSRDVQRVGRADPVVVAHQKRVHAAVAHEVGLHQPILSQAPLEANVAVNRVGLHELASQYRSQGVLRSGKSAGGQQRDRPIGEVARGGQRLRLELCLRGQDLVDADTQRLHGNCVEVEDYVTVGSG